jgi:hypothetical protein
MPAAIDAKPPRQRFDQHPRLKRIARKKPAPVILGDDAAEVMAFLGITEREYRDRLFRDFIDFCRRHNAWVVSPSHQGRARVQIAEGSALLEKIPPRYPVARLPGISERIQGGRMIPVAECLVTLWR